MVSGYVKTTKLKKLLVLLLCVVMVSNNTLPVIAETNASYEEIETTIASSEFEVEENKESEDESIDKIESLEEETQIIEEAKESEKEIVESENIAPKEETDKKPEEETSDTIVEAIEEEPVVETTSDDVLEATSFPKEEPVVETTSFPEEGHQIDAPTETTPEEIDIASKSEIESFDISTQSEIDLSDIATQSEIEKEFPDENEEEVMATGFIPDDYVAPIADEVLHYEKGIYCATTNLPSRYDSRQHKNSKTGLSYIPPVRNQKPLNTCWAFSAIAMFEASLRIRGLVKTESESNLSEAALAYYTYGLENITNDSSYIDSPGLEGHDYTKIQNGNFISRGGNANAALFVASAYAGIVKENSDTSYSRLLQYENKETQYSLNKKYAFKNNDFALENAYFINKENSDIVKRKIMENGAVGISYCSARANANSYNDDDAYMHYYGDEYYYFTNKTSSNHGIVIVGWDDTIPASRFFMDYNGKITKAKNPGGWLCRNSWGADWRLSNGGYFWMSYEEPSLQYTMLAVDAMKSGVYKYNYHYDTTGNVETEYIFTSSNEHAAFANIFKVPDNENHLLEATSIAISSSNTILTIEVYVNNKKMNNPTDGTLKSTVTVERETAGIFTIPLEDKVLLSKGSYFSIVVRGYSTISNALNIFCDCTMTYAGMGANKGNPVHFYNAADYGQSFSATYRTDKNSYLYWDDLNYRLFTNSDYPNEYFGYNYRIKGLANPVSAVTISFDSDGGEGSINELNVISNTDAEVPKNVFTKKGYTFSHWVDQYGNEYNEGDIINSNSDVFLKAIWTPIEYNIKYNANGGNVSESSVKKIYGTEIVLPTPTKKGHNFLGWYKESSLTNIYNGNDDITTNVNDSVNLYAKWSPITYTIVYDLKGVSATKPKDIEKTYLTNVKLEKPTNIPSGYKFVAWYKDSAYKNQYTGREDLATTQDSTITIYAKWKQAIIFDANGHGVAPSSYEATTGDLLLPSMSANGYKFGGWYKEAECKNLIGLAGHAYYVTGPITLYAKWTPNVYKVTLKLNGGSIISGDVKEYTYGIGATLPKNVKSSKNEEEFIGWYDNAAFKGNIINKIDKSSTGDKIFYAKYLKAYIITFEPGDGEGTMDSQIAYEGKSVVLNQSKFTKSGYTFSNWKASNGKTYVDRQFISVITNDITLVATWKKNKELFPSSKVSNGGGGSSFGGGGGGGSGGGSRGGGITINNSVLLDTNKTNVIDTNNKPEINNEPVLNNKTKTEIKIDRSVTDVYNSSSAEWVTNDNNGKLRLNIKDDEGKIIHPAYGFIQLDSIKTVEENNQKKEIRASDTYFFDENGDMVTGWVQTYADKWYYFNTENNSEIGKMAFGWKKIDGEWYYFALEGSLYRNETTPDGYTVDENGKWIK